ncbi:unnamed protein product [Phaedon cochleariae]|uniref:Uncharacterized protein n=1 Tax=Phaedon cochleariae TaxID=80249 RepID=A0A9P0DMT7_PHACE|nr:unnamed protein product [Phaedon cochleariae]
MFLKIFFTELVFLCATTSGVIQLKIAGVFDSFQLHQSAFVFSNELKDIDKGSSDLQLSPVVNINIFPDDPFSALQGTCSFLRQGVVGIFGPQSSSNIDIIQSIAGRKEIPQILTRWVNPSQMGPDTINFYPSPRKLASAFVDIIRKLEWRSFTILFTNFENLMKITDFIKQAEDDGCIVYLENIDPDHSGNYRQILREVMNNGQTNFILDCPIQELVEALAQIQQVGMLTKDYNYILSNLDAHTKSNSGEMDIFMHSEATIRGVHLVNPQGEQSMRVSKELCYLYKITFNDECSTLPNHTREMDFETASIIDAVHVFKDALHSAGVTKGQFMDCNDTETWEHGATVINILESGSYRGLTGTIEFGDDGFRSTFELTIYKLQGNLTEIGTWNTVSGLDMDLEMKSELVEGEEDLTDKTLIVMITLTEPYAMLVESPDRLIGNEKYEGFAIDLIDEIAKYIGFQFVLVVRSDNNHGVFNPQSGKWTGMIGDIIEGKADLAISDLSITKDRVDPVEFTQPFMNTGIGILFHKPTEFPVFFHFAQPFSKQVWIALGLSYLAVTLTLFIIGRLTHSEWEPRGSQINGQILENQLTLCNSMWIAAGSIFRQNTGVRLNSVPANIVSICWRAVCFIILAMFIAYSASVDIYIEKEVLFNDVNDLVVNAENHNIKFGALKGGATQSFFKNSKSPVYEEISNYMDEHPEDLSVSTREGIERAENEHYAFFMESATIDYTIKRHCKLASYGGLLDSKGFGIAVRKGSPLLTPLNRAILKLHTSGDIMRIKQKWWEEKNIEEACEDTADQEPTEKDLVHLQGLFWITIVGTIFSLFCAIVEFIVHVRSLSKKSNQPFGSTFCRELKGSFRSRRIADHNNSELHVKSEDERNTTTESVELI